MKNYLNKIKVHAAKFNLRARKRMQPNKIVDKA